jgi:hypothetical protein
LQTVGYPLIVTIKRRARAAGPGFRQLGAELRPIPEINLMPRLKNLFNPKAYAWFVRQRLQARRLRRQPNLRGTVAAAPGHYHSPLLDIQSLQDGAQHLPFDGPEWWEHIDLRPAEQRAYFEDLLDNFPFLPFPAEKTRAYRYFTGNEMFRLPDAFTLSGVIRKEKPRRIVEVGSGFSSAVMLDTLRHTRQSAELTFIEPFPERIESLLSPEDRGLATILVKPVQEVPLEVFDRLEANDVLFIDSSHVAKVGSDVTLILLRVLPRLKPGVIVHFHDIFYPYSYPINWIREGIAWNESLFLRAFLAGNAGFQVVAFNSFASHAFPEIFRARFPDFLNHNRGSLWLRKIG